MTFSIAAGCSETGQFGVVVTSSSICVASRCAFVRSGAGAALSQNITDPSLGPLMLKQSAAGDSAQQIIDKLVASQQHIQYRQLALIDKTYTCASFTGEQALGVTGEATGRHCVAVGNLLHNDQVPTAMVNAFESANGSLADRLLDALDAGQEKGGEAGPVQSAGLLIANEASWPVVDLRVDWSDTPLGDLRELWQRYEPQLHDYQTRAKDPRVAPAYGVPGDPA